MIFSLWNQWCDIVKKHNDKLTYVNQEEAWSPYNIFIPFLYGAIISIIVDMIMRNSHSYNSYTSIIIFIISTLFVSILMIINWLLNE